MHDDARIISWTELQRSKVEAIAAEVAIVTAFAELKAAGKLVVESVESLKESEKRFGGMA